jgi:CDP-glycerol glycerophosphotransferase
VAVLSVIVPVYGVDQYLRECLDSILAQTGDGWTGEELEVIAVDDHSLDGSGEILAEYAARDPRLHVVTHATNQGLGAARNTGLDHATGDYVWFVDSDDWLTPGSLAAVADRIRQSELDVLVVGYERCYVDGRVVPERLLPDGPPLPDVFTAREQPRIMHTLPIVCNKVMRRDLIVETGARFTDGWYEDISFSQPLLLAAKRISVLERLCYAYRQRADGAITYMNSERHQEAFEQWHRVMTVVEFDHPDLHPLMFQRMIWHYLGVLNHPARIHRSQRRGFFRRIVADYRTYRPPGGYPNPGGVVRLQFTLVALNLFTLFAGLRAVYRSRSQVTAAGRALGRAARRAYYVLQRSRPLTDEVAVYVRASHQGYPGSPHARTVASVVDDASAFTQGARSLLIVDDVRLSALPCARRDSLAALRAFARARVLVSDGPLPTGIRPRRGQQSHTVTDSGRPLIPAARTEIAPDNPTHVG